MKKAIKTGIVVVASLLMLIRCETGHVGVRPEKIQIIQRFVPGTAMRFEVQRGKIDASQPGTEKVRTATEVVFSVREKKDNLIACSWKYGATTVLGMDPAELDEQSRLYMNIYEGMDIRFTIDTNGVLQELTNFEECRTYIENAITQVYKTTIDGKKNLDNLSKMMDVLKSTYETPEVLVSTYCPELTVYFQLTGQTLKPDSSYVSDSDLPNPFGGRSFPTKVTTKIDSISENNVFISTRQSIPETDLNKIMQETFVEISKMSEKPFNAADVPRMNMSTTTRYIYDHVNRVMRDVYAEKVVDGDKFRQTQVLKVTQKL